MFNRTFLPVNIFNKSKLKPVCRPSLIFLPAADLRQLRSQPLIKGMTNITEKHRSLIGRKLEIDYKLENMQKNTVKCKIGPSILNADLSQLYAESQRLLDNGADYLHLDVMDGNFVPNLTFGHPVVKCLRKKIPCAFFETHMMVQDPHKWTEPMADAGVNQYTFHIEPVIKEVLPLCRKVREAGMRVGLALKPGTGIEAVRQYIDHADMILIMTVEPGFGGQKFMADMMPKVQWLRHNYPLLDIEVDGGVGLNTITACAEAGANMIVSGTAITNACDQRSVIASLRETVERSIHKCNV